MNSSSIQKTFRWTSIRCYRITLILIPVFLLSSCAVGPNYKRPNVATPPTFRGGPDAAQQASLADLPWWASGHVPVVSNPPATLAADLRARKQSSVILEFLKESARPLAAMALHGSDRYMLVSGSETYLLAGYHCTRPPDGHPFYPPPGWTAGMLCWCNFEIVED